MDPMSSIIHLWKNGYQRSDEISVHMLADYQSIIKSLKFFLTSDQSYKFSLAS